MSNPYDQQHSEQHLPDTNPWSDAASQNTSPQYGSQPPQQQQQQQQGYAPPQGPPPGQPPRHSDTFQETDFVPENERGEQREAMEQFEMSKAGNESQHDKDVAQLQSEFPGLDGSLIAALYSDAGNMGATREMLQELAGQTSGAQ